MTGRAHPHGTGGDAADLPGPERLKLARILLDLTEPATESIDEVQAAWEQEIERRLLELRSGKVKGISLEDVRQRIESRLAL